MFKKWKAGFPAWVVGILLGSACTTPIDVTNDRIENEKPYGVDATVASGTGTGGEELSDFKGGVYGSFPANMCAPKNDNTFAILSITPSPATPLANDTVVDVTAVVAYSIVNADTLGLVAFDGDANNTLAQTPALEEVAIQPGCGQVTLTLNGISTAGYQGFVIAVVGPQRYGGHGDIWETWLNYQVEGEPYVKFTRINHPLNKTLPLVDGRATISAEYEYNLQGGYFDYNDLYAYSDSWYGDDVYPDMPADGTYTGWATWSFRPQSCQDNYALIEFDLGTYDQNWNYYESYPMVRWMVDVPDIIVNDADYNPGLSMQAPGNAMRSLSVENCSNADRFVHLTDNAAWLYPQAASVSVPANSSVSVTYAVNGAVIPLGLQSGQLTVIWDTGARMAFLHNANIIPAYSYSVATSAMSWYDDAVTGSGTLIGDSSDCCGVAHITLPFNINVYGLTFSEVSVWPYNGAIMMGNTEEWFGGGSFPSAGYPMEIVPITTWWLYSQAANARTAYAVTGLEPNRKFIVSAYKLAQCCWSGSDTFQVVFSENTPGFDVQYGAITHTSAGVLNFGDGINATTWTPAANTTFHIQHP